jgi:hypothetical protein
MLRSAAVVVIYSGLASMLLNPGVARLPPAHPPPSAQISGIIRQGSPACQVPLGISRTSAPTTCVIITTIYIAPFLLHMHIIGATLARHTAPGILMAEHRDH